MATETQKNQNYADVNYLRPNKTVVWTWLGAVIFFVIALAVLTMPGSLLISFPDQFLGVSFGEVMGFPTWHEIVLISISIPVIFLTLMSVASVVHSLNGVIKYVVSWKSLSVDLDATLAEDFVLFPLRLITSMFIVILCKWYASIYCILGDAQTAVYDYIQEFTDVCADWFFVLIVCDALLFIALLAGAVGVIIYEKLRNRRRTL